MHRFALGRVKSDPKHAWGELPLYVPSLAKLEGHIKYPRDPESVHRDWRGRPTHNLRMRSRLEDVAKNPQLASPYLVGIKLSNIDRIHNLNRYGDSCHAPAWMQKTLSDPHVAFVQSQFQGGASWKDYDDDSDRFVCAKVKDDLPKNRQALDTFNLITEFNCVGMLGLDIKSVFDKVDFLGRIGFCDGFDNTDVRKISWYVVGAGTDQKVIAIVDVGNQWTDDSPFGSDIPDDYD